MNRPGKNEQRDSSRTTAPARPAQDQAATKGVPHQAAARDPANPSRGPRAKEEPTPDARRAADDHRATLKALVDKANGGDRAALADLRRFLDGHPEVWQICGDLGRCAERAWLELLAAGALGTESVARHVEQLRADLAGPSATPIERLLVDRAVVCYLSLHHAELVSARSGPSPPAQVAIRLKRCESAQRRYLGALRMLALLRATLPRGLVPVSSVRLYGDPQEERKRA
jgi:hypothetical protein